jgi:hypothetical protein
LGGPHQGWQEEDGPQSGQDQEEEGALKASELRVCGMVWSPMYEAIDPSLCDEAKGSRVVGGRRLLDFELARVEWWRAAWWRFMLPVVWRCFADVPLLRRLWLAPYAVLKVGVTAGR